MPRAIHDTHPQARCSQERAIDGSQVLLRGKTPADLEQPDTLAGRRGQIQRIASRLFDFPEMSRRALAQQARSRWAVFDIAISGVSLVSSDRSQFNRAIQTSSYEALLRELRLKRGQRAVADHAGEPSIPGAR